MRRFTMPAGLQLVAFTSLANAALFGGTEAARAEGLRYSIGLYAGATTSPFEADKVTGAALPDFLIEGDSFSFGTNGLTYDVIETESMTLSARLAPRFGVADPSDVAGLEHLKRDIAVEAGLSASLALGQFQFAVEALKDVSDTHDGMAVTASVGTMFELSDRFSIGARAGATWMDRKLATYSYGVLASEARAGLPAYQVQDSLIPSLGIEANFALSDHMALVGGVSAEFLPDSVTASPIVKRDTVVSAMIGVRYAF
jgi:MipA family protein